MRFSAWKDGTPPSSLRSSWTVPRSRFSASPTAPQWCRWPRPRTSSASRTTMKAPTPVAWARTHHWTGRRRPWCRMSSTASRSRPWTSWASKGYPNSPRTGEIIEGMSQVGDEAYVLHAGTALDKHGSLVSAGGRVLSVVATGADLTQARDRAYRAVDRIGLKGSTYRTDIALAAQRGEITVPQ